MLKKNVNLIIVLSLAIILVFANFPANASANEESFTDSVSTLSAPNTIYYETLYYSFFPPNSIFHQVAMHGTIYRGYLTYSYNVYDFYHAYHGTLYRDPLPYPIP